MPLVKTNLENQLTNFFKNNKKTPEESAKQLANIIDAYIKSATVVIQGSGLIAPGSILTAGSPAAQSNTNPVISQVTGQGNLQ